MCCVRKMVISNGYCEWVKAVEVVDVGAKTSERVKTASGMSVVTGRWIVVGGEWEVEEEKADGLGRNEWHSRVE